MADTVSDYMSLFKQEIRDTAVATASRPAVRKVALDHSYRKNSFFALAYGIVFEYGLTEGRVTLWFPFEPSHTEPVLDCVHRWPAVDNLSFTDDRDRTKQHIKSFCCGILRQGQRVATPPVTHTGQRQYTVARDVSHELHVPGDMFQQWSCIVTRVLCAEEQFSCHPHSKLTDEVKSDCQTDMDSHDCVLYILGSSSQMLVFCCNNL